MRVWTHAEQWDGRGSVKAWLYRIGTNLTLNQIRSTQRRPQESLELFTDEAYAEGEISIPGWLIDASAPDPETTFEVGVFMAVGYPGDPETLPEKLRDRELEPRERFLQQEFVMNKTFGS